MEKNASKAKVCNGERGVDTITTLKPNIFKAIRRYLTQQQRRKESPVKKNHILQTKVRSINLSSPLEFSIRASSSNWLIIFYEKISRKALDLVLSFKHHLTQRTFSLKFIRFRFCLPQEDHVAHLNLWYFPDRLTNLNGVK